MSVEVICHGCGKLFSTFPSRVGRRKFCSRDCRRTNYLRPCEWCGETFVGARKEVRYCSEDCRREGQSSALTKGRRDGYVVHRGRFAHRRVAERSLGRSLEPDEVVHHINEDPGDNRPENLEVMTRSEHHALHRRREAQVRAALKIRKETVDGTRVR